MQLDDKTLKQILLAEHYVSDADITAIETSGGDSSLFDRLVTSGLLTNDLIGQAVAEHLNMSYADLNSNMPSLEQTAQIPVEIAQKFRIVYFSKDQDGVVTITSDNPEQTGIGEALAALFPGVPIRITYSLPADISAVLDTYRKPLDTRFSKIIAEQKRIAPEIIGEILSDAISFKASDIHFEPQHKHILVRFRVDGVLQEAGKLPREQYDNILNRIKVQSHLRIDEHFSAQDGSMRYEKDGTLIDFRTSIVPTVEGEKIVLRVLAAYVQGFTLADIGLEEAHQQTLKMSADKPFGMILVAGPTGSGKTTTLYTLLRILNQPDVNITTIEDPVEYKVQNVNQIQVNPQTELTFAKGLRSIVRQDPDIILVGEIRDEETAEIAVNAALTGHLLLSTFHANDAATAIPRLLEMGIEPFLLASTLDVIIAQRLVRKICEHCRYGDTMNILATNTALRFLGNDSPTLYHGKGCAICGNTGYKGRTAIFEIIRMTPELQDLTLRSPSSREIWLLARKQGSLSLFEDGIEKVKRGITTLEELMRVAEAPQEETLSVKTH